ncbi:nucleoid occlusion factor SlmA [Kushneria phosphatilytica]|uniref:Nucleoid occlusion factor SlmA n=1 Tax=Kushneria phosphatilytica TaxID=657387 RepID=A0A1S1NVG4_9GAMM|nr:nucleoid occlusion factor SlmA [Kushneria phosphatilytica]OHV10905.1 nucleoid occlusion factor SlmA [Kushneria phosphatilytica]QEL12009.1 nucleoid occlusion factor SlmA [Kushneria phosphatilytica]
MTQANPRPKRRDQILQALAHMLEEDRGRRITTAALARQVGVSEAALYRHFPSKAKMFEALIEFIEQSLFERVQRILEEESDSQTRCRLVLALLLGFAEKNPGLCRLMTGDALNGENARLRARVAQLFDRLETQLKQVLREAQARQEFQPVITITATANLLMATVEGRITQYVRSDYQRHPTEHWEDQWQLLARHLLTGQSVSSSTS